MGKMNFSFLISGEGQTDTRLEREIPFDPELRRGIDAFLVRPLYFNAFLLEKGNYR
jgi:hypothetical protein